MSRKFQPAPLRFWSNNTRGLDVPEKRSQLLRTLWSQRMSMAFLQETHFKDGTKQTLTDCWRAAHPETIPAILPPTTNKFLPLLISTDIGIQGDSDHSPVSIQIKSPLFQPKEHHWQLNETVLSDTECSTLTTQVLTQNFETNTAPEVSPLITWEAHKCVVRGHYINLCTRHKRENTRHMLELTKWITELKTTHKRELTEDVYLHLTDARRQLRDILSQKLLKVVRRSNRYFYEYSNKCGRLLARTLQQRRRQNHIHKIAQAEGTAQ
ncbi:Hypothetical predicted protein, partial [Pelobates cultripes]